ncbi:MAG: redoxin domain-containing protein [Chitinophagaceae bacterium]|nr:redoxin domain-containing protein [Chitinophagaceae bacterium]
MTKYIRTLLLAFVLIARVNISYGQDIAAYDAEMLMKRLAASPDTLFVVNFWATWCGPCVKELPEFDKLAGNYKGRPVKVLLVSLDFKEDYQKKIPKFVQKKKLEHEVVWFNETNANEFIPKIDNEWQGSIPATLLFYKKRSYRKFIEGTIHSDNLKVLIDKQLMARY